MIEFKGVVKKYGGFAALRGLDMHIPRGVTAGLVGPNGSGKTTTIKLAVGLLKKSGGEVRVLGLDPWYDGVELRRRVGVLHEKPLYPQDVTVRRLLEHLAGLRGLPAQEAVRVARLAGIEGYMERSVSSLSRGYLQRLGIAIALMGEPELLLLDEPTANLDPSARFEILGMLENLKKDLGVTMVISSHVLPELEKVCDYAVVLSGGVAVAQGSLLELARRFMATLELRIETRSPRLAASRLILSEAFLSVEVSDGLVVARVPGEKLREAEAVVEDLRRSGLAESWSVTSRSLGEVYEAVSRAG
ncbi:ABC transporter ATP-binding protein [Thermofilum pendens]|uniref:ABC transporter related n=1 Tax=Thermofilum pendens (strain DSM 2475 / Hrk 5) TaxID=368408 RepID=A1S116_THEPD|nr:ABC transporter ATP-binding protein [Thermofilum pendens]ABL79146.1 ABC transporter related [Thermofilum pendens Hrk 5]